MTREANYEQKANSLILFSNVKLGGIALLLKKKDFTPDLKDFLSTLRAEKGIDDIGVYFRDLNNGPIIGVNYDEAYAPASLLKVPLLISFLRFAEEHPEVFKEEIQYGGPSVIGYQQAFPPLVALEEGAVYSTQELLEHMIRYSDNQALILLFKKLPRVYQEDLFKLVGVDEQLITDPNATLTVRQYSIFFRILFNASFLSQADSEYALKLLTETTFTEGLRAGVPENVVVAHKFGERKTESGLQQFHDCGIVYYPNHPYMLCIMTRGEKSETLIQSIKDVSTFVYQKIDDQYGS